MGKRKPQTQQQNKGSWHVTRGVVWGTLYLRFYPLVKRPMPPAEGEYTYVEYKAVDNAGKMVGMGQALTVQAAVEAATTSAVLASARPEASRPMLAANIQRDMPRCNLISMRQDQEVAKLRARIVDLEREANLSEAYLRLRRVVERQRQSEDRSNVILIPARV